jgi:hypothetical protein
MDNIPYYPFGTSTDTPPTPFIRSNIGKKGVTHTFNRYNVTPLEKRSPHSLSIDSIGSPPQESFDDRNPIVPTGRYHTPTFRLFPKTGGPSIEDTPLHIPIEENRRGTPGTPQPPFIYNIQNTKQTNTTPLLSTPHTVHSPSPQPGTRGQHVDKNLVFQSNQDDLEKIKVSRESINRYDYETKYNINQYAASIDKLELERERSPFIKYAVLVAANMQEQENTYINSSKSNKFITDQKRQIDETNRRLREMSGAYQRMLPNREENHLPKDSGYTEEQLTLLMGMNVDDLSFNRTAELALQMANTLTYESTIRLPLRVKTESLIEMGLAQIGRVIRPSTPNKDGGVDERISDLAMAIIKDSTGRAILANAMAAHMIRERIDIRTTSQSRMKRNDVLIHNETSINALVNYLRSRPFVASFTMSRGSFISYAPSSYEVSYNNGTDDYTDASPDEMVNAFLEIGKLLK